MYSALLLLPVTLAVSIDNRIINGQLVEISDYPWQGSFRAASGDHTCGCVFVGNSWSLTAAHCGGSSSFTLGYGNANREGVTVFPILSITSHPDYGVGGGFQPNDFAVIRSSVLIDGPNISPGTVYSNSINPEGAGAISGWGRTCPSCELPLNLQGVPNIPIISDSECEFLAGNDFNAQTQICVYNGQSSTCVGDSGGALSVDNYIYGLASWSDSQCSTGFPSVYAKVGAVYSWICGTTANNAQGC